MPAKDEKAVKAAKNAPILAVGLKKGHVVTKKDAKKDRPSRKKAVKGKRFILVKEVIREVAGYAPYERRVMELLRNGLEKRAMRLARKKLGSHSRAKRKQSELSDAVRRLRERKD
eukprot:TRINITY_DN597_c0_g1_i1.p1 TRINITY_DN597_c0_g1~~TRINITY_DN597_c0_g1_i1.p1  ORF type:complete len:132 (-),score=26.54 TRINITY_DN597_c0_g1_i1:93-437(-)